MGKGPLQAILPYASGISSGLALSLWMNLQKLYELRLADQKASDTIKALPTLASRGNKRGGSQPRPL